MKIIKPEMMDMYISKYKIDDIFTMEARDHMNLFLFKKNEYICRENEDIKNLYFFVDGKAKVFTTLRNGRALLLCFYEGFKVLGDLELFYQRTATTNVQVIEDSYCIGISTDKIKENYIDDPKFLRFICNSLSEKLNRCSRNSSINLLYPLENRIASYILLSRENDYYSSSREIEFSENLTEISELLGTSYRHLLRTMDSLCRKGALQKKDNCYIVVDKAILKKLAVDLYK